jgi:hypothetical protein
MCVFIQVSVRVCIRPFVSLFVLEKNYLFFPFLFSKNTAVEGN